MAAVPPNESHLVKILPLLHAWGQYPGDSVVTDGYSAREMKEEVRQKKSIHVRCIFLSPAVRVKAEDTSPPEYIHLLGAAKYTFLQSQKGRVMVTPFLISLKKIVTAMQEKSKDLI